MIGPRNNNSPYLDDDHGVYHLPASSSMLPVGRCSTAWSRTGRSPTSSEVRMKLVTSVSSSRKMLAGARGGQCQQRRWPRPRRIGRERGEREDGEHNINNNTGREGLGYFTKASAFERPMHVYNSTRAILF
jgi:hypothetical protein